MELLDPHQKKGKIWFFVKKSKFWKNHYFSKSLSFVYPFYPCYTFLLKIGELDICSLIYANKRHQKVTKLCSKNFRCPPPMKISPKGRRSPSKHLVLTATVSSGVWLWTVGIPPLHSFSLSVPVWRVPCLAFTRQANVFTSLF